MKMRHTGATVEKGILAVLTTFVIANGAVFILAWIFATHPGHCGIGGTTGVAVVPSVAFAIHIAAIAVPSLAVVVVCRRAGATGSLIALIASSQAAFAAGLALLPTILGLAQYGQHCAVS